MSRRSRVTRKGGQARGLKGFAKNLTRQTMVAAVEITKRVQPVLTREVGSDYDSGQTVYDELRPLGVEGNALSLVKSGRTRSFLKFVPATGTRLQVFLPDRYTKYLIGKYGILPAGNQRMPDDWKAQIGAITEAVLPGQVAKVLDKL